MKAIFRKIGAFFFISIFFFNAVLYYAFMGILDIHAKAEMSYSIRHNPKNIIEFDIPVSQLKVGEQKEFYKDGVLYDVVHTIYYGNTVHLYVIIDNKETDIISKVADHVSVENGTKASRADSYPAKGIYKLLGHDYIAHNDKIYLSINKCAKSIFYSTFILQQTVSIGMVYPPPEFIIA